MQRVRAPYNTQAIPTANDDAYQPGYFQDGDPSQGQMGTVVPSKWLNDVQEEIASVIEGAGVELDGSRTDQLLTAIRTLMLGSLYQVGDIYLSMNADDPSKRFGGTWERISGYFLIGADGQAFKAGSAGGSATKSLTLENMPSHSHSAEVKAAGVHAHEVTVNSAGTHTHTRGTMEITGSFDADDLSNDVSVPTATGAFGYFKSATRRDAENGSKRGYGISFTASKSWTGSTSENGQHTHGAGTASAGQHTHGATVNPAGGGKAFDVMPPYYPVYVWRRTA